MSAINKILRKAEQDSSSLSAPQMSPQKIQASPKLEWIPIYNSETTVQNSMSCWPNDSQIKKDLSLPQSLHFRLFGDIEPPEASFKSQQLNEYRCFSCKAFINRLCHVVTEKSYDCSICGSQNVLSKPIDVDSIEMTRSIYEVEASEQNQLYAMTPPTIVLVIDVSKDNKGCLFNLGFAVKQWLKQLPSKDFFQVAIVTYDKYIHHYDFGSDEPKKIIMVDEAIKSMSLTTVDRVQEQLVLILDDLERQADSNSVQVATAHLQALEFAWQIARPYSGRILLFGSVRSKLPRLNTQQLANIRPDALDNHRAMERMFQKQISEGRISVSFFIFTSEYVDLLSYYPVSRFTNGSLHHYRNGTQLKFYYDLITILFGQDRYDTELKVRFSPGVRVICQFGGYLPIKNSNDHVKLFTCNTNTTNLFEYNIEARINRPYIVTQFSLLFTTAQGKRRFRIINYVIELSDSIPTLLSGIDYANVNFFYLKAAIQTVSQWIMQLDTNMDPKVVRTIVQDRFARHLNFCRQIVNEKDMGARVNEYARATYFLLRSKHLNIPYSLTWDWDHMVQTRSIFIRGAYAQLILNVLPLLYSLDGDLDQEPETLELNQNVLQNHFLLLLDKSDELVLWIHSAHPATEKYVGRQILDLFRKGLLTSEKLQAEENPYITRLNDFVARLRSEKPTGYQPIRFKSNLSEYLISGDTGNYSYNNFINFVVR